MSRIHHPQKIIFKLNWRVGGCLFLILTVVLRLQDQQIYYLSIQLLISLVAIYRHCMQFIYLHTSLSTSKTSYWYDNNSTTSELTLVCRPKVRKNRIRCVMKRRRCPGSTLLSLQSHLLNSSIKPIATKQKSILAISWGKNTSEIFQNYSFIQQV